MGTKKNIENQFPRFFLKTSHIFLKKENVNMVAILKNGILWFSTIVIRLCLFQNTIPGIPKLPDIFMTGKLIASCFVLDIQQFFENLIFLL